LRRPLNSFGESPQVEAQFSIPYGIALAIARRHVFIEDFCEEKIRGDTGVLQLAKKVKVIGGQGSIESIGRLMTPVVIEIKTKDEKIYSGRVDFISGSLEKPASMEAGAEKFRKCAAFSAKPLPKGNIEEIIRLVKDLEAVPDISTITRLTV
jgi:2-methylcitrate dehydratase PrpD